MLTLRRCQLLTPARRSLAVFLPHAQIARPQRRRRRRRPHCHRLVKLFGRPPRAHAPRSMLTLTLHAQPLARAHVARVRACRCRCMPPGAWSTKPPPPRPVAVIKLPAHGRVAPHDHGRHAPHAAATHEARVPAARVRPLLAVLVPFSAVLRCRTADLSHCPSRACVLGM